MRGKYSLKIESKNIHYELEIFHNVTLLTGDSANGKSQMCRMVEMANRNNGKSGIKIHCEVPVIVLSGEYELAEYTVKNKPHSIFLIDETAGYIRSKLLKKLIEGADGYFILISRSAINTVPVNINAVYTFNQKKITGDNRTYNYSCNVYGLEQSHIMPEAIAVEDSGSGYEFWKENLKIPVVSAKGNANMHHALEEMERYDRVLSIIDGAGCGGIFRIILDAVSLLKNDNYIWYPESFEYLLLKAGIFPDEELSEKIEHTENYADSAKYLSWERYYYDELKKLAEKYHQVYQKQILSDHYRADSIFEKVKAVIPEGIKM